MRAPDTPNGLEVTWSPAMLGDAAALSDLFNEIATVDDTPERLGPDTMEHELVAAYAPLEERTIVARADDEIVAYGTVYHRDAETDELRTYVAVYVKPSHRGRGLEDAILDRVIAAATEVLGTATAAHKYVCSWLYKKQEEAAARFERRGFTAVRHWWEMDRLLDADLPVSLTEGVVVIPWEDKHAGPVRLVANAAFADHWGSTPMDEEAWQKRMLDSPGFRQDLSFVAMAGGDIVGYAYNEVYEEDWESAGRSEAWVGALGVLRDWRKRGIATALLAESMNAMRAAGLDAAMIGVDSSSPSGAQHLYQAVGFTITTTGTTWQREVS